MNIGKILSASVVALSLASCAPQGPYGTGPGPGLAMGTLGGGAAGGLLGAQLGGGEGRLATTAAGTLIGALLGSQIGQRLDANQRQAAAQATNQALATNNTITWRDPDRTAYGTVTPVRTYQAGGRSCREYIHTVYIDGRAQDVRGTACQAPDGSWQVVG